MCTRRGTREPPMRSMSSLKAELACCSHPKLVCPHPGMAVPVPPGSKSAPTLFTPTAKPPKARLLKVGKERCHPHCHCPWQSSVGTRLAAPHPTTARAEPGQQCCPLSHPHNPRPIRTPVPRAGWAVRQGTAAPQAKARMFPNLGQKQQAEGLLIASRGALVCLSILQQTRFAALIPIWK